MGSWRRSCACLLGAALFADASRAAEQPPRPAASDFFRYAKARVTVEKDGKEKLHKPDVETLHGSDLRDEGLFTPVWPRREDLARIVAFRWIPSGTRTWTFPLHRVVPVQARATFRSEPALDGGSVVHAEWTFASRGKDDGEYVIRDGLANATITAGADGIVRSARVHVAYTMPRAEPKKGDQPTLADDTWDFTLAETRKTRYPEFREHVSSAIDRGVARLRKLQKDDGTFEPHGDWTWGTTALSLYTLLSCGVPRDDPQVAKGLTWLASQDVKRNYELSLGLMALERAYVEPGNETSEAKAGSEMPAERRAWCVESTERLESQCSAPGSFGYPNGGNDLDRMDTSNTQYACLGLRAAARLRIPVSESTWVGFVRHFRICREKDGPRAEILLTGERQTARASATSAPVTVREAAGFRYRPSHPRVDGAMTCAGIASMAIARDELVRAKSRRISAADDTEIDQMTAGAWAWLDGHWAVDRHPGHDSYDWHLYWLYSLERAGLLTGVRLVNGKDWYFDGAMEILAREETDGGWVEHAGGGGETTMGTCFALLFLKRATAPAAAVTGR